MPADTDIVLEDGTVWDGSDPEEPYLCRRLKLCESCQSLMASPDRIESLKEGKIKLCPGSGDGTFTCSMRAITLAAIQKWNYHHQELMTWTGEPLRRRHLVKEPSQHTYDFGASSRGTRLDINALKMRSPTYGYTRELFEFDVYAFPDDPAAEYVSARPPMIDVANEASDQIKSWFHTCCETHPECPVPTERPLPTRLLYVGSELGDSRTVRVHEAHGETGTYAALSYCWGGPQPVVLREDTYKRMTSADGIELRTLPLTIQDAVRVTRSLGLKYLWVDAICILQDSGEDMRHELRVMASVYKNAHITISAASAKSCQDGFLQHRKPRKSQYPRFELPYRAWDDTPSTPPGRVIVQEETCYHAYGEPANKRAWCLQESMLSPRLVIFGTHELLWQCRERDCEQPTVAGGGGRVCIQGLERLPPTFFDPAKPLSETGFEFGWIDVFINYSQRDMSFEGDKLVAVAGLASEFQKLSDGDTYVAGLWGRRVTDWLSWMVDPSPEADRVKGRQTLRPRPSKYIAPSWSWASVNGVLSFAGFKCFQGEVLRCEVTLKDESLPFGAVTGGVLEIRTYAREARWCRARAGIIGDSILDGTGPDSKPAGRLFMDADEEQPELLLCVNLYGNCGIACAKKGPSTYMRVGWVQMELGAAATKHWWEVRGPEVIVLI